MFFSFDGIDGVGKTTQIELFREWLESQGYDVVTCRDPGSTALGERVRELLLKRDDRVTIAPTSEMLLYMAARAQLVDEVIRPALADNKVVVSDRYLLANLVYQAHAGGLDTEAVRRVGQVATGGLMPDAVFLLDMAPAAAAKRIQRELDRVEQRGDDYREKLRQGFLAEAALNAKIHVIDAAREKGSVQSDIRTAAAPLLD